MILLQHNEQSHVCPRSCQIQYTICCYTPIFPDVKQRQICLKKTHPLEDLLPPDIQKTGVQVADALGDVDELGLVGGLDVAGADGQV